MKSDTMSNARILVVEDDRVIAQSLENHLQHLGYAVSATAVHGDEAVRMAGETRPDLVLIDTDLCGRMSGLEAARQIRTQYGIPTVYLTAHGDEEATDQFRASRPYSYLFNSHYGTLISNSSTARFEVGLPALSVNRPVTTS